MLASNEGTVIVVIVLRFLFDSKFSFKLFMLFIPLDSNLLLSLHVMTSLLNYEQQSYNAILALCTYM